MTKRKEVAETLAKYGYEVKHLPRDLRKNLTVVDRYSGEKINITYGKLFNKIINEERQTVGEHEYVNTALNKFRERFNLQPNFFSTRNLE